MKKVILMMSLLMFSLGMQAQAKFHDVEANDATGAVKCIKSSMMGHDLVINFSRDGKREGLKDTKYDKNGYLISATIQGNDLSIQYTWENGKIKTQSMSMMGQNVVTTRTYNDKGAPASEKIKIGGTESENSYADYKYDNHGNWISRKELNRGQEQTRFIEYYDGETSKEDVSQKKDELINGEVGKEDVSQNNHNRSRYSESPYGEVNFALYYPDGTVVKYPYFHDGWQKSSYIVINDTICFKVGGPPNKQWYQNALNQDHFSFSPESLNGYRIYSPYYNFESFSEKDVANFFKNKVLPYVRSEERNSEFYLTKNIDDYYEYVAKYENGKVTTKATQEAKKQQDVRTKYYNLVNSAKKLYGATYVDAALNGKLVAGMPFDLLREYDFWDFPTYHWEKNRYMTDYKWQVEKYLSALGLYRILRLKRGMGPSGSRIDYFKVKIRNGKIAQIYPE